MFNLFENFLKSNSENDIYVYQRGYAYISDGYKLPDGEEFRIYAPLDYNLHHCRNFQMMLNGSNLTCVKNNSISLDDYYTYKTDNNTFFVFIGKTNYIILTTDKNFNYLGLEVEEVQQIFATSEERKLHTRIEELEGVVKTLTMRVEALERNSIYLPQTNPPQITSPLEWSSKPHPWIRSSNRSDG